MSEYEYWEPFVIGRPHAIVGKVLAAGGAVASSGGAMFEIFMGKSGAPAMYIFHLMPTPSPEEVEGYTKGPIKLTLSEINGRPHMVLLSGVGNAEMCYEPLLHEPKDRPLFPPFDTPHSRCVVTYLLVDSVTRCISGMRAFTMSPHMSKVFVKLVMERCQTAARVSQVEHVQHMDRVAQKYSIVEVAKRALAYTRHDKYNEGSIEYINV